ncbi:MAG: hypothetical protein AAF825_02755 [Pseudomonadota bacterium]
MNIRFSLIAAVAVTALSACVTEPPTETLSVDERIAEAARPGQDLSTVRLQSDGCYYWLWSGPVEDTLIPLESREGRAICARRQGGGASSEES